MFPSLPSVWVRGSWSTQQSLPGSPHSPTRPLQAQSPMSCPFTPPLTSNPPPVRHRSHRTRDTGHFSHGTKGKIQKPETGPTSRSHAGRKPTSSFQQWSLHRTHQGSPGPTAGRLGAQGTCSPCEGSEQRGEGGKAAVTGERPGVGGVSGGPSEAGWAAGLSRTLGSEGRALGQGSRW